MSVDRMPSSYVWDEPTLVTPFAVAYRLMSLAEVQQLVTRTQDSQLRDWGIAALNAARAHRDASLVAENATGSAGFTQHDTDSTCSLMVGVAEAARRLGVETPAVRAAITRGRLPATKPDGVHWAIQPADVEAYRRETHGGE